MQREISFRGFKPMDAQTSAIEKQIAHFTTGFPHISSISLVVASPGQHHRKGDVFEIGLRARLPTGKELDVSSRPKDERYGDFYFALNDTFKRARRLLKDKAEKLRGEVKSHPAAASKTISE